MSRFEKLLLSFILLLAFGIQIYSALNWEFGYDEGWNLYFAKVHPFWESMIELKHTAHPPFSVLILRLAVQLGDAPIWARLASVIPGIVTIFLIFLICRKLGLSSPISYLCAFFLAVSHTYVNISVCVRAYILAVMFLMISYYYLIDILRDINDVKSRNITIFVFAALFAIWTEYCAIFVVIAIIGGMIVAVAAGNISLVAILKRVRKDWMQLTLFLLGAAGVVLYFFWTNIPVWWGHVGKFYLSKDESVFKFAGRGIAGIFNYFTPLYSALDIFLLIEIAILVCILIFLIYHYLKVRPDIAKANILITLVLLTGILFIAGVLRKYPFGGLMRHQFILFPFIILFLAIILDHIYNWLRYSAARYAFCTITAVISIYLSITGFSGFPVEEFPGEPLFQKGYQRLREEISNGEGVYLTTFNHYAFFRHTLDWIWKYQRNLDESCYFYKIQRNKENIPLFIDRGFWLPEPSKNDFIFRMQAFLRLTDIHTAWVFSAVSNLQPMNDEQKRKLTELFRTNGLDLKKWIDFDQGGYAFLVCIR